MSEKVTPMMQQYNAIKAEYPDCFILFRLGDFYELFGDDAVEASRLLNLTLTKRQTTPMCGVPHHAAQGYIGRLTQAGKKVAVCEQLSDPTLPGIVKRDVVRVITPGTTFDERILDGKQNHFLVSVAFEKSASSSARGGLACADITTGEFLLYEFESTEKLEELMTTIDPAECVVDRAEKEIPVSLKQYDRMPVFPHEAWETGEEVLKKHFKVVSLESFGIEGKAALIHAAGLLMSYLRDTQKSDLNHLKAPRLVTHTDEMIVDDIALRNLELIHNMRDHSTEGTLLSVIDYTKTAMGGRLLKQWLTHPSTKRELIESRFDALDELIQTSLLASNLADTLAGVLDIERLLAKLSVGAGNARDILGIGLSLQHLDTFSSQLGSCTSSLLRALGTETASLTMLTELSAYILRALVDEPPLSIRDGNLIREGFDAELDELKKITREGKSVIAAMQEKEIAATGISSLKIRFNNVFGYYLEVTKSNLSKVPAHYIRKQTTANGERFITPELKELEEKILTAETRAIEIEYDLFVKLRARVCEHTRDLQRAASVFAQIDVLLSLAHVAQRNRYVRPTIADFGSPLEMREGRHAVIESLHSSHFVPNDTIIGDEKRCVVITGPNMGGKSTYLRQVALITLLAHMGSFVPASSATIPLTDRIFTRVGASDNLVHGQSTFMVEMQETARILHYATSKSLIILDEIGRGTSTYDGVSLAWAILEYIHSTIGAKTLFATHYHELIAVADRLPHACNMSVMVKEEKGSIVFLYQIKEGAINRSYGVEVARLAGLPAEVIGQAKGILADLEEGMVNKAVEVKAESRKVNEAQMDMFVLPVDPRMHRMIKELDEVRIEEMTPLQALNKLGEWKNSN